MKTEQKSTQPLAEQTLSLSVRFILFSLVSCPGLTHYSIHLPREDKQTKKRRYKASVCVQENKSSKSASPQGTGPSQPC